MHCFSVGFFITVSCCKKRKISVFLVGLFLLTLLQVSKLIFAYSFYFLIGPRFCLLNMVGRQWHKKCNTKSLATDDLFYYKELQFFVSFDWMCTVFGYCMSWRMDLVIWLESNRVVYNKVKMVLTWIRYRHIAKGACPAQSRETVWISVGMVHSMSDFDPSKIVLKQKKNNNKMK